MDDLINRISSTDVCIKDHLQGPLRPAPHLAPVCEAMFGESWNDEPPIVSRSISTGLGIMRSKDLLCFSADGSAKLEVAQFFVAYSVLGGSYEFLACVADCVRVSPHSWTPTKNVGFLEMGALRAKCSYAQSGKELRPLVPMTPGILVFDSGDARRPCLS